MTALTFGKVPIMVFRGTFRRVDNREDMPEIGENIIVRYGVHYENGEPYVYCCSINGPKAWHHYKLELGYFSRAVNIDKVHRLSLEEQQQYLRKYCRHFDARETDFILMQGFGRVWNTDGQHSPKTDRDAVTFVEESCEESVTEQESR